MKKIFLTLIVVISSISLFANSIDVNEKVLNAFNKTFPNVKDIKWTESKYFYEVNFKQDLIIARVTYDHEGNIVKTLRYYYGEQLPIFILEKVKNRFAKQTIYGVTEESTEEGTQYHISLQDAKNWILITSDSYGSITVDKKYNKA
ncbi:MAG: hypothetical protein ACJ748_16020 [Flavisolibacter sp.]